MTKEILKKLLFECAKCVDEDRLKEIMEKRYDDNVMVCSITRLTKQDLIACKLIYEDIRKDYTECLAKLSNLAHSLEQLGQFLGIYKKEEKKNVEKTTRKG